MTPTQKIDLLRAACCVAGADGDITVAEMIVINRLVDETGVGKASLEAIMQRARTDSEFCEQQFKILNEDPSQSMTLLLEVAMADGHLSSEEVSVLERLAENLNIPADVFTGLVDRVRAALSK